MTPKQAEYLNTVPPSAKGILERAFAKSSSRTNALKGKCLQCTNYDRQEVRDCTVELCPLHAYRPFQPKSPAGAAKTTSGAAKTQGAAAAPADWDEDLDGPWTPESEDNEDESDDDL
ncbi:MAG: hypothetical protein KDG50_06930 [Chromatiales bacterium]|nr:hypothetical protein [Chromatiales bacterium]